MKKFTRWLTALGMTVALLGCSAALADEPSINVQLDGQALTFTDAVPQVKDQRTFLPFRAVFEAMGAEVSSEGSVITAVRDGKTLTMTLNETAATLTEGDKITPITMDVAPYVDSATWRTYVPVRFAAQAFGCAVGWDQGSSTAVIVDTDKVVAGALEGKSFTYLEKLMEYSRKYNEGIWDMDMTMDGSMTMLGAAMPIKITTQGTVADETKLELDMKMTMDMTQLMALSQQMGGGTELAPEDKAMMEMLAADGIGIAIRGDVETGKLYVNVNGKLMEEAFSAELLEEGQAPVDFGNMWFTMDLNAIMAQAGLGMDWGEYLTGMKNVDYMALVKSALSEMDVDSAETGYAGFKTLVEKTVDLLSDEGFVKDGDTYTTTLDLSESMAQISLALTMKKDTVVGYSMEMTMGVTDEATNSTVTTSTMVSVDENDRMTGKVIMNLAPLMTMDFDISGGYEKGTTPPATEPPAGATVVDLMEWMGLGEQAALGVIGGADGPTAIIVGP